MATYKGTAADAARSNLLAKQRDADARTFQDKQEAIRQQNSVHLRDMNDQFAVKATIQEDAFKAATVGLVTASEFKEKRKEVEQLDQAEEREKRAEREKERRRRDQQRKSRLNALSFQQDEDEETHSGQETHAPDETEEERKEQREEEQPTNPPQPAAAVPPPISDDSHTASKRAKLTKNPDVDTSFLPDAVRQAEEARLRQQLAEEWRAEQDRLKQQPINITYSYWDGSGHRRRISIERGSTVGQFLERVRRDCQAEFSELRSLSADHLIYVKEDLIIPQHHTFYQLIVTQARGKSGPLFHFDVRDDVRLAADARVEKEESHAGKICTRAWYERNQHIFPASRWEVFDAAVQRDRYTIKGGEVK